MSELVLYRDENFTQPFIIESMGKVDAGDEKSLRGYLKNEIELDIEQIHYETSDDDLFLDDLPSELKSDQSAVVFIKFKPKKTRELGLNSFITIKGKKVVPPE